MKNCTSCQHWSLKAAGAMAHHGYGCCAKLARWQYFAPGHTCDRHQAADDKTTAQRVSWLARKGGNEA